MRDEIKDRKGQGDRLQKEIEDANDAVNNAEQDMFRSKRAREEFMRSTKEVKGIFRTFGRQTHQLFHLSAAQNWVEITEH